MYNRKFNIKKDFSSLIKFEEITDSILNGLCGVPDGGHWHIDQLTPSQHEIRDYLRSTFDNQWKISK
tara:strand:- start:281 stop:481 length:201 start_codon:yes stop_codon:yes gene_type:complete